MRRRRKPSYDTTHNVTAYRAIATWPTNPRPVMFDNSDRARVRSLARRWAAAGARVEFQRHTGYGQWKTERTLVPHQMAQQDSATTREPAVEAVPLDDVDSPYERLMHQTPGAPGRHRGRTPCRHVVGGTGIR